MSKQPSTSVIVPTRNRPQAIECCLDALAAQTLSPGSFEVIVVDDGSEPALSLNPARWSSQFELRVISQENTGAAGARNCGAACARGEFLAFTDDDCLPTPTWLEKLTAALRKNPGALIGGSTFNGLKDKIFAETSQLILEMVYEHFNQDPSNAYFFASNNMAMSRESFLGIEGFDTTFRGAGAEDREFCNRCRGAGRALQLVPEAVIEHRHFQTFMEFSRLHFRYGRGAHTYQRLCKIHDPGNMKRDLAFHRSIPKMIWRRRGSFSPLRFCSTVSLLCWWEVINAAGFFSAPGPHRPVTPPA